LNRTFLALMCSGYKNEKLEDGSERVVLALPAFLAPVKIGVFPLVKKDGLPEKAREIFDVLKFDHQCFYDEKDSIGKRYRRQDALGTPFCITVDHDTLVDNMVTIRDRDTMLQERISIEKLKEVVNAKVDWRRR
jgi:glycyl-tRNA synthetase